MVKHVTENTMTLEPIYKNELQNFFFFSFMLYTIIVHCILFIYLMGKFNTSLNMKFHFNNLGCS